LKNVLFPLGDMCKPEVRKIAEKYGLSTAEKKDSTGICFIGEKRFREFLKNYIPCKRGDIVDLDGKKVGEHDGVMYYTLGQRRGLNIGGTKDGNGERWFVIDKDVKNNKLIVSQGEGEELFSNGLISYKINWIPNIPSDKSFECFAKFRYRQPDQKVRVTIEDNKVRVDFAEKQRAVTPGQFVVFYTEKLCLGGGVIEEVF
jgi:tRNA-specific 2-thiouridylase